HPVLASHRTPAADHSGGDRPQLLRPSGADERPAAVAAARRAAPFLQRDRLHPDGHRDVLPFVSARRRTHDVPVLVRMAPGVRGIDVLQWPVVGPFLRWRHARTTLQLVLLIVAAFVVVDGLYGA